MMSAHAAMESAGRRVGCDGPGRDAIARACGAVLESCARFLEGIDQATYERRSAAMGATIGQHVRHALDHYASALRTPAGGVIDYDHRTRATRVETDLDAALAAIRELLGSLEGGVGAGRVVVRAMVSDDGTTVDIESTVDRELAFVFHHAVHHHAMIGAIAGEFGVPVPSGFGRAPSTANHERGSVSGGSAGGAGADGGA